MTDRERLIELFLKPTRIPDNLFDGKDIFHKVAETYADIILSDGWIRPPCKVGDTVYIPWHWNDEKGIAFTEVEEIKIYDKSNHYMFLIDLQSDDEEFEQSFGGWKIEESIGKTVFLTTEEAEKALAERQGETE